MATCIEVGTADDIREHGMSLLELHRREIQSNNKMDPEWVAYYALEEAGALFTLCVWRDEPDQPRELIGYSVAFLRPHLHSRMVKMAQVDLVYLLPTYRKGSLGKQLMTETEDHARSLGASVIYWHSAPQTTLDCMLRRQPRYKHIENIFTKEL